jgi:HSP20 family molecular chaperone IbpA
LPKGDKGDNNMTYKFKTYSEDVPLFDLIEKSFGALNQNKSNHFPYADVYVYEKDRELYFDLAVAGYTKEDIKISIKDNVLTISCDDDYENDDKDVKYIENGIAKRKFKREWTLGPQVDTKSGEATFENGILSVAFKLEEDDSTLIQIK